MHYAKSPFCVTITCYQRKEFSPPIINFITLLIHYNKKEAHPNQVCQKTANIMKYKLLLTFRPEIAR